MDLKRKRSVNELCLSPSSDSSFDSPPHGVASIKNPFAHFDMTPIHLHSRTMKRFRNSRPTEEEVHQRTLNLLFSAQQNQSHVNGMASEQQVPQQRTQSVTSQQSLHRFWNISSTPSTSISSTQSLQQSTMAPSCCDDCGTNLADGQNERMNMDGFDAEAHACGACGKHVCFSCSVSNLGEQRRCLQCAGPRPSVGNMDWAAPALRFC